MSLPYIAATPIPRVQTLRRAVEGVAAQAPGGAPLRLEMSLGQLAAALATNESKRKEAERYYKRALRYFRTFLAPRD